MQPKYYGAAATYNKPVGGGSGIGKILKVFGLFVGVIILIAVIFSIVSAIGKGPQDNFAKLVARESNLQQLLDQQRGNIKNSDFRTITSTASLLLVGDSSSLNRQLSILYGLDGVPDDIASGEVDSTSGKTLKNAVLTGTFDSTYLGILRDKIAANYQSANTVLGAVNNDAAKAAIQKAMDNLTNIDDQLSKLQL